LKFVTGSTNPVKEEIKMTEPNKAVKGKNGPGPGSQLPPMAPQVQSIMAVVVPAEIFEQMKRAVKRQPYEDVELLIQAMKNLIPQQVNMGPPPG